MLPAQIPQRSGVTKLGGYYQPLQEVHNCVTTARSVEGGGGDVSPPKLRASVTPISALSYEFPGSATVGPFFRDFLYAFESKRNVHEFTNLQKKMLDEMIAKRHFQVTSSTGR